MLRAAKGDADDIETSLLSQVVVEQQLEILEEETKNQEPIVKPPSPLPSREVQTKVKRKEMKWEPQQHREGTDKEAKTTAIEEIHIERQKEESSKQEGNTISEPKEITTVQESVALQDNTNSTIDDVTIKDKQQNKIIDKQPPTVTPTVLFKQLKQQYQSISDKLKEQEERELARRATLESRKKDAAQLREARQSQKQTEVPTSDDVDDEKEEEGSKEIVIQLDQMGSYAAFNDDRHDNATMVTHKKHTQSIKSSVGDDEYYQHMTNNVHLASKAT